MYGKLFVSIDFGLKYVKVSLSEIMLLEIVSVAIFLQENSHKNRAQPSHPPIPSITSRKALSLCSHLVVIKKNCAQNLSPIYVVSKKITPSHGAYKAHIFIFPL